MRLAYLYIVGLELLYRQLKPKWRDDKPPTKKTAWHDLQSELFQEQVISIDILPNNGKFDDDALLCHANICCMWITKQEVGSTRKVRETTSSYSGQGSKKSYL